MKFNISFFLFLLNQIVFSQQTIDATITHDGLTREYKLYIPTIYTGATPVPLVFNLHGYTSNNLQQMYYGDFRAIADTANFIIALPQGTLDNQNQPFWNARFTGTTVDDLGFIDALIDSISADYNINQDRVYSTGMSNGGFMSFTLACELSNRITAIASVTGSMTVLQPSYCTPNRAVPIMQIHGTADATVNYNGSTGVMGINQVLNQWIANNNVSATPTVTNLPDINTSDGCTATRYDYLNGTNGSEVVHYKITGGAHTWPGTAFSTGVTNQDFNASVEIWNFFNRYKMSDFVSISEEKKVMEDLIILSQNPFDNNLTFRFSNKEPFLCSIIDISGKTVFNKILIEQTQTINLENLTSGIYFIQVGTSTKKIIKK